MFLVLRAFSQILETPLMQKLVLLKKGFFIGEFFIKSQKNKL